jgi:iron complex outermembrane recepter protein
MSHSTFPFGSMFWAAFVAAVPTLAAAAQPDQDQTQSAAAPVLNEIVVTATKRSETVIDVPAAVDVFTHDQLIESGHDSLSDLQASIPNFFFSSNRSFQTNVTMRGLGAALTGNPGVGLYIDGAYQISVASFTLPLFDLERVEVLKGPQGTLYGRNSEAGAINYITRPPSEHFEAEVNAEVGNGDTRKGSFSASGPLVGDVVTGRISAGTQRQTGFYHYSDGSDADANNYDAVDARIVIKPLENFRADFRFAYQHLFGGGFVFQAVKSMNDPNGHLLENPRFELGPNAGKTQSQSFKHWGSVANLTYEASSFEVVSITSQDREETSAYYDDDLGPSDIANAYTLFAGNSLSEELRIQSKGDGPFRWLAGSYYTSGTNNSALCCGSIVGGSAFAKLPNGAYLLPSQPSFFTGFSGFTDEQYDLTSNWTLGAGLRYDDFKSKAVNPTVASGVQRATFTAIEPKAVIHYRFNKDQQLYASATKGFSEGGINTRAYGTPYANWPNSVLWSYELGYKSRFADGRGQFNISGFFINASSYVSAASVSLGGIHVTVPTAVGRVHSDGFETDASYRFTDHFSMQFNGGWNKAIPVVLSANAVPGAAVLGQQVTDAPKWNFQLGPMFTLPAGADRVVTLSGDLSGTGPTSFQGSSITGQLARRNPYFLLDLAAALDLSDRYRVTAFVKNATNRVYATDWADISALIGATSSGAVYGQPRFYGVSFEGKFR